MVGYSWYFPIIFITADLIKGFLPLQEQTNLRHLSRSWNPRRGMLSEARTRLYFQAVGLWEVAGQRWNEWRLQQPLVLGSASAEQVSGWYSAQRYQTSPADPVLMISLEAEKFLLWTGPAPAWTNLSFFLKKKEANFASTT